MPPGEARLKVRVIEAGQYGKSAHRTSPGTDYRLRPIDAEIHTWLRLAHHTETGFGHSQITRVQLDGGAGRSNVHLYGDTPRKVSMPIRLCKF
jgi:hypothetical protein